MGPLGPKFETELKMSSRGLVAPGSKEVKIRVEKESKSGNLNSFSTFFHSFSTLILTFWTRPRELIFNSVSNFGPEGPKNSSGANERSQQAS